MYDIMAEQDPKEPTPDTPESILKDAVLRSNQLDAEAREALFKRRDTETHRQKLIERAQLIAGLYARVEETVARGQSFPEGGLNQLEMLSDLARRALKQKDRRSSFALSVFLTPKKLPRNRLNPLEEIVRELYPTKTEVIK